MSELLLSVIHSAFSVESGHLQATIFQTNIIIIVDIVNTYDKITNSSRQFKHH